MSKTMNKVAQGPLHPLVTSAATDLIRGLIRYDLWGRLGLLDIKRRYRRTVIGPFWSAISLGVFIAVMGTVGIGLWKQDAGDYLPFLASGMLVWVMISSIVTESCIVFVSGQHLFSRMRIDYSLLAYTLVWRNFVVFLHNFLVYLLIVLIFPTKLISPSIILVIPGLLLLSINAIWLALLLGMFCLRFRDVQQLITTILQISLFVTPIFWPPDMLTGIKRSLFVDFNPLYCFIDIVRSPLLGKVPASLSYELVFCVTAVGWLVTYRAFFHFRKRIAFWV
jgi:ABC-type polysaccharide/polyol phosphate export permease